MSGVELATAYVNLAYQDSITTGARRELAQVERDSVASGKKVGSNLSSGVSGALKAAGGLLAAGGVGGFLRDSIAGARESNKVAAVTANAIKVTGGAAKVTARQVGDLAAAISAKTGVDDEAIQSGANLLLTFKNVRNEVGAGNDIFSQATASAQDLAAAGFGSADSAAKMLGKALNDPIKGMSALGRAGVTFTAAQKKQIAALVETGDVLGAQKIIMAEVQSQVGGAAEATATAGDKAAVAFGNLLQQGVDCGAVAHIGDRDQRQTAEYGARGIRPNRVDLSHHHPGAATVERLGDATANAATATGNEHHLAIEIEHAVHAAPFVASSACSSTPARSSGPRQNITGRSSTMVTPAALKAGIAASDAARSGVPSARKMPGSTTRVWNPAKSRPSASKAARMSVSAAASAAGSCNMGIQPSASSAIRRQLRGVGAIPIQIGRCR